MKTFSPDLHEYKNDGVRLPGATDVIKAEKLVAVEWMSEEARWRGKCVHRAIELYNLDDLVDETLDDEIRGYVASYRNFLKTTGFELVGCEKPCFDQAFGCMPDLWGIQHGCKVLVELKTGPIPKWAALQTALQKRALAIEFQFHVQKRFGLRLMADGSLAKLDLFDNPNDERVVMGMVDTFHWKKENGYIKWEDGTWQMK